MIESGVWKQELLELFEDNLIRQIKTQQSDSVTMANFYFAIDEIFFGPTHPFITLILLRVQCKMAGKKLSNLSDPKRNFGVKTVISHHPVVV